MDIKYRFKGRILGQKDKPLEGLKVKAYDEKGTFLGSAISNKQGNFDFECGSEHKPRFIKMSYRNTILSSKEIGVMVGTVVDLGDWIVICFPSPKEWHLKGRVLDKMSGEPLKKQPTSSSQNIDFNRRTELFSLKPILSNFS